MKNNLLTKLFTAILAVFFCTADFAYSVSVSPEIKTSAVKLGLAMFGVVMFSILLSVGLSLYNKFFVSAQIKDYKLNRDSLRTPQDKNEAIMMFITKNRLK